MYITSATFMAQITLTYDTFLRLITYYGAISYILAQALFPICRHQRYATYMRRFRLLL